METDEFDPWAEKYSAADITAATQGAASKRVLQNWHARGQWVTAVEPTLRGLPGGRYDRLLIDSFMNRSSGLVAERECPSELDLWEASRNARTH